MRASQPIYRPLFAGISFMLLLVLTWTAPGQNAGARGQQRLLVPEQAQLGRSLSLRFAGEQPRPLAMVSGDFDEDGVNDLVIGYGLEKGGSIAFLRGNLDAVAPQTEASWLAVARHEYSEPFLQQSEAVSLATEPDVMISADINGDGHLDLIYASLGARQLNVMLGDGKGNFAAPFSTQIPGGVTALAAYQPGFPATGQAIVAGYKSNTSARLSILTYNQSTLQLRATYALPGAATAMIVTNLDADSVPDTAIVAGGKLLILHGSTALTGRGSISTLPITDVESVAAGEFLFDRHAQMQLSVLTSSGDVVILAHQGFDPRPYTPQQIAETRRQQQKDSNAKTLAQQAGNNGNEPWVEVETHMGLGGHAPGEKSPILLRSRGSGGGGDDLVVINPSRQLRTQISHALASSPDTHSLSSARVISSNFAASNAVAALSLRVNPDARQGLVVLNSGNASPEITVPSTGNTFFVNTTADNTGTTTDPPDSVRCTQGSAERCTLRDAITFVNSDATDNITAGQSDTIMLPSGTYNLTWQAGAVDANANALTHLEVLGPVTIIGSTAGSGTIINGNNNDTILTINPGPFGSFNPSGASYVFDMAMENVVLENASNPNNVLNSVLANNVGGALNWDAFGTGNLTLTNTTVQNCVALWGPGGGIWIENSAGGGTGTLTISNSSISNNSTPELGGGIDVAFAPPALVVTNTTFTGNKAQPSVNPGDSGGDGSGGGLFLEGRQPPPATPQSTLTNMTITSNVASNDNGGGIATFTGIVLSGSIISNNSSGGSGGGIWSNTAGDGSPTTITNSNFLSNSATTSGGAIALGIEPPSSGNALQVSLSRIFGNTSTHGASGLANGISGQGAGQAVATDNWWGCNTGPTTSGDGCDQATLNDATGTLTTAPFAQLGFSSNITTIPVGGSMNLTVSLNKGSDGNPITGAFPAVATNYPYNFAVTGVTADPALTTGTFNTSGVGSATLTPVTPPATTTGKVTVTFDNQTDTINFTAEASTATSLAITATPSTTFLYGQPASFTVQLTPASATGITTADFQVLMDGSSSIGGSSFGLVLISNNNYQIFGPFNLLPPGGHTLKVNFLGTTDFSASNTSASLSVSLGTVTIGDTVMPTNPVQGQGGTVTVTVAAVGSGFPSTGSITYAFDGGTPQTIALTSGAASISIPTLIQTGNQSLSLAYSGDTNYAAASTTVSLTIFGRSQTTIAAITSTTATIDVFGFGFTAPSGQLAFMDVTSGTPVAAPVTLNTSTAATSLLPQVTTSTGANTLPDWTTLADINGDGKLDLVTSLYLTDSVSVQLGKGDGTFQPATTILIAPGFGPAENHLVSLRGNGTLDLVVASFNINQIAVLLGNGNGTFGSPVFYTVGTATNAPTSLTTGDFNHDGELDVAVANTFDNTISVLIGNGTGALTVLGAPIPVGHEPQAIRAGDFNGDGYSDLAVANYRDGTVTTLLNNRNGTFTATTISVGSGAGSGPQALAINGSGATLLLAVANYKDNTVSVFPSNGSGAFGPQTIVTVDKGPDDVNFADLNGDGLPDLVVSNYTSGTVSLVLEKLGGGYSVLGPFKVGNNPYSAAVGDLDLDGTPDIVVSNCFSNDTGTLLSGTQISVPYSGLSLTPGNTLNAMYSPNGGSKYGGSTSRNVTAP